MLFKLLSILKIRAIKGKVTARSCSLVSFLTLYLFNNSVNFASISAFLFFSSSEGFRQ
jgi:hypothetical protein